METNYFIELNKIDVNDKTKKKNGLTYLSWAWAWGEIKKKHPDANYKIYENKDGWNYHTDNKTCWVKTGVTINEIEHIEYLPVMDYKNKSIPCDIVTSFDINKAIQRSLTKAVARHGLGLYIYVGEDLPECDESVKSNQIQTIAEPMDEIDEPTDETLNEAEMLEIDLEKVARYNKVAQENLTETMLRKAIEMKLKFIQDQKKNQGGTK